MRNVAIPIVSNEPTSVALRPMRSPSGRTELSRPGARRRPRRTQRTTPAGWPSDCRTGRTASGRRIPQPSHRYRSRRTRWWCPPSRRRRSGDAVPAQWWSPAKTTARANDTTPIVRHRLSPVVGTAWMGEAKHEVCNRPCDSSGIRNDSKMSTDRRRFSARRRLAAPAIRRRRRPSPGPRGTVECPARCWA